jgi:hypothetical protein
LNASAHISATFVPVENIYLLNDNKKAGETNEKKPINEV